MPLRFKELVGEWENFSEGIQEHDPGRQKIVIHVASKILKKKTPRWQESKKLKENSTVEKYGKL